MELPVGLDLVVGIDFMRKHDVILLTASLKVLFGTFMTQCHESL